jgi:hypothetical protein
MMRCFRLSSVEDFVEQPFRQADFKAQKLKSLDKAETITLTIL